MPDSRGDIILCVDDQEAHRYIVSRILKSAGFRVEEAATGAEALLQAQKNPAVIILDVNLPDISGWEVCRKLKSEPATAWIPVLHLSASFTAGADKVYGLDGGAEAYLTEPVEPGVLIATIKALLRMRRAEDALRSVISVVSHDLRTPLSTVDLCAELLLASTAPAGERNDFVHKQAEVIRRAVERMKRLVGDLLLLTKLEAGKLVVNHKPVAAGTLLDEAFELLEPLATKKSIRFDKTLIGGDYRVDCDEDRILQVFSNLIGNAVRFTPEQGCIKLASMCMEVDVQFSVSDSGTGIALENLDHIFDRFWQARETADLGTGLGLAIAKGIVEAHDGRIWVESSPGAGSTFRFTLPRADLPGRMTGPRHAALDRPTVQSSLDSTRG